MFITSVDARLVPGPRSDGGDSVRVQYRKLQAIKRGSGWINGTSQAEGS